MSSPNRSRSRSPSGGRGSSSGNRKASTASSPGSGGEKNRSSNNQIQSGITNNRNHSNNGNNTNSISGNASASSNKRQQKNHQNRNGKNRNGNGSRSYDKNSRHGSKPTTHDEDDRSPAIGGAPGDISAVLVRRFFPQLFQPKSWELEVGNVVSGGRSNGSSNNSSGSIGPGRGSSGGAVTSSGAADSPDPKRRKVDESQASGSANNADANGESGSGEKPFFFSTQDEINELYNLEYDVHYQSYDLSSLKTDISEACIQRREDVEIGSEWMASPSDSSVDGTSLDGIAGEQKGDQKQADGQNGDATKRRKDQNSTRSQTSLPCSSEIPCLKVIKELLNIEKTKIDMFQVPYDQHQLKHKYGTFYFQGVLERFDNAHRKKGDASHSSWNSDYKFNDNSQWKNKNRGRGKGKGKKEKGGGKNTDGNAARKSASGPGDNSMEVEENNTNSNVTAASAAASSSSAANAGASVASNIEATDVANAIDLQHQSSAANATTDGDSTAINEVITEKNEDPENQDPHFVPDPRLSPTNHKDIMALKKEMTKAFFYEKLTDRIYPMNFRKQLIDEFNVCHFSNAGLKLTEILHGEGLVRGNGSTFRHFGNCELPGSFVVAIHYYFKIFEPQVDQGVVGEGNQDGKDTNSAKLQYHWIANSLFPGDMGPNSAGLEDKFNLYQRFPERWLMWREEETKDANGNAVLPKKNGFDESLKNSTNFHLPPEMNGDITKEENLKFLEQYFSQASKKVDLYTSDAGIRLNITEFSEQEKVEIQLKLAELYCGLISLKEGGSLIIKLYTVFEKCMVDILILTSALFRKLKIIKPMTSKPTNSEVYLVGKGFLEGKIKASGSSSSGSSSSSSSSSGVSPLQSILSLFRQKILHFKTDLSTKNHAQKSYLDQEDFGFLTSIHQSDVQTFYKMNRDIYTKQILFIHRNLYYMNKYWNKWGNVKNPEKPAIVNLGNFNKLCRQVYGEDVREVVTYYLEKWKSIHRFRRLEDEEQQVE